MLSQKVVILAAGLGKRMKSNLPKSLIPIEGKPMIKYLLTAIQQSGIDTPPIVVVSPGTKTAFTDALGCQVEYVLQTEQLGTGHALAQAEAVCVSADRIIVLYGDHPFITPASIKSLLFLSDQHPHAVALLTTTVPNLEGDYLPFTNWSRILRDQSGNIVGDKQVKDASAEELKILELNPAIYSLPAPWVWDNLKRLTNKNAAAEYYLTDLLALAANQNLPIVSVDVSPFEVIGVNTPEELAIASNLKGLSLQA